MATVETLGQVRPAYQGAPEASAVSWGAILAGAVGAAALSLILVLLGTGLGFSAVSPWANQGASAAGIGFAAVAWLTFTQIAASGMGGYLAGRLRTRWAGVQVDEVYFRDTAHGFMAWAVATLITAAFLGSVLASMLGAGVQAGAAVAGGAATAATATTAAGAGAAAMGSGGGSSGASGGSSTGSAYFIDSLFRRDAAASGAAAGGATSAATSGTGGATGTGGSNANGTGAPGADTNTSAAAGMAPAMPVPSASAEMRNGGAGAMSATPVNIAEVGRIFANGFRAGSLPAEDSRYLGQLIAQRTGLSQQDAEKRVTDTFAKAQAALKDAEDKARAAADAARKASSYASLWLFISLLFGAFVASLAATFGGRQRDL